MAAVYVPTEHTTTEQDVPLVTSLAPYAPRISACNAKVIYKSLPKTPKSVAVMMEPSKEKTIPAHYVTLCVPNVTAPKSTPATPAWTPPTTITKPVSVKKERSTTH